MRACMCVHKRFSVRVHASACSSLSLCVETNNYKHQRPKCISTFTCNYVVKQNFYIGRSPVRIFFFF